LGVLLTQQLKTERLYRVSLPTRRVGDLAKLLQQQEEKRKQLEEELVNARNESASALDNPEVLKLQTLLGLTTVEGSGLLVTLNDSDRPLLRNEDPADLLVHFDHLAVLVNQLWAAGAEAICINEERVVLDSGLSCAGTTILLNTRRIAPPYVIKAIGDPEALESEAKAGVLDELRYYDLRVSESIQDRLVVPAYKGSFQHDYARALPSAAPRRTSP
jgi:uncharacterized protein YlxW (UPF0749 family)